MVTKLIAKAHPTLDKVNNIKIEVIWSGVDLDRPCVGSWSFPPEKLRMANRLIAAIDAQAVYLDPKLATDINGKTYVAATSQVMGKYLNADLKRLGF